MSIVEIKRFAADLKSNNALRAEAEKARAGASHATPVDRVAAFAASKGYAFTADEAREHGKATAKADGREPTDAELDGVAGGISQFTQRDVADLNNRYSYAADDPVNKTDPTVEAVSDAPHGSATNASYPENASYTVRPVATGRVEYTIRVRHDTALGRPRRWTVSS